MAGMTDAEIREDDRRLAKELRELADMIEHPRQFSRVPDLGARRAQWGRSVIRTLVLMGCF